jgi:hypothetical protein
MQPETTLPGSIGWVFWYAGELAFKWVPGFVVALAGAQGSGTPQSAPSPAPVITEPVSVLDVVRFMQLNSAPGVYDQLYHDWNILVGVSIALSLVLGAITVYSVMRTFQIRQAEYKHYLAVSKSVASKDVPQTQLRWDRILEQANSENDQARRVAILEADIMLAELLDSLGYRGETLADKMRQVNRANFNSIDLAWEAHRARNKIAHEAGHTLAPHEAKRVIGLYDKVFREFGFLG